MKFAIIAIISAFYIGGGLTGGPQPTCVPQWRAYNNEAVLPGGIVAGLYKDGSPVYVACGIYTENGVTERAPGRLKPEAGVFTIFGSEKEVQPTHEVMYLYDEANCCSFVEYNPTEGSTLEKAVKIDDLLGKTAWISKESVNYECSGDNCPFDTVGKYCNLEFKSWFTNGLGGVIEKSSGPFQILVCDVEPVEMS